MEKRRAEIMIGLLMITMLLVLPFSVLAGESDGSSGAERAHAGMRPVRPRGGEDHIASGVPAGTRGNFRNRANRRRDGLVSKYEENQAKKDPGDGSFADKAVHSQAITSKGESIGKPAWMDNNPLKPATDSEPEVKTPATLKAQEIIPAAQTQTITPGTGDRPPAELAR